MLTFRAGPSRWVCPSHHRPHRGPPRAQVETMRRGAARARGLARAPPNVGVGERVFARYTSLGPAARCGCLKTRLERGWSELSGECRAGRGVGGACPLQWGGWGRSRQRGRRKKCAVGVAGRGGWEWEGVAAEVRARRAGPRGCQYIHVAKHKADHLSVAWRGLLFQGCTRPGARRRHPERSGHENAIPECAVQPRACCERRRRVS